MYDIDYEMELKYPNPAEIIGGDSDERTDD